MRLLLEPAELRMLAARLCTSMLLTSCLLNGSRDMRQRPSLSVVNEDYILAANPLC